MTKSELIKTVAKQASLTEAQTNEAVKALTDVITAALAKGCLLYTSPSPRDVEESRMPSSA